MVDKRYSEQPDRELEPIPGFKLHDVPVPAANVLYSSNGEVCDVTNEIKIKTKKQIYVPAQH